MVPVYRGRGRIRNYRHIRRDPLAFLSEVVRQCGDFARVDVLTYRFYVVNDPALVHEALVEQSESLVIRGGVSAGLARLIGDGILTNRGARWRESRALLQPLFHRSPLTGHLPTMVARVQESLDRWRTRFAGRPFSISRELLALSYRITCSTLFRYVPTFEEAEEFADAMWVLQLDGMKRHVTGVDYVEWVPSAMNRRVRRARATLVRLAQQALDQGSPDEEPALPLDEALSLLFAGTESPVNTLCFSLMLLERHPEWRERVVADLKRNESAALLQEVEGCRLLSQVISESVRLFPAGWAFERFASEDVQLGGEPIRKGARLLFSPFLMHRNPRFWREPERFDPLRFPSGSAPVNGVPKYGYMPFGAGPRSCIGSRMALAEMRITLGMILTQCEWRTHNQPADPPLEAEGSFKIRLSRPLVVTMAFRPTGTPPQSPPGT